jgi:hypothetical protein
MLIAPAMMFAQRFGFMVQHPRQQNHGNRRLHQYRACQQKPPEGIGVPAIALRIGATGSIKEIMSA